MELHDQAKAPAKTVAVVVESILTGGSESCEKGSNCGDTVRGWVVRYMWVRRSNEAGKPIVLFDYMPSRGGAVPFRILDGYKGYLQTDGYAGYDKSGARDGVTHVGCLAHARRKFFEAVKAQHKVG